MRSRTIQSSGWTEPEPNWTVSFGLASSVLWVSLELNFGNPNQVGQCGHWPDYILWCITHWTWFCSAVTQVGFHQHHSTQHQVLDIFYYEALAITSAVLWASSITPCIQWLLIYIDSLNCVEIFNSLHVQDGYNNIILFMVHILISMNISLFVFHIPTSDNSVIDALSHHLPSTTVALSPV